MRKIGVVLANGEQINQRLRRMFVAAIARINHRNARPRFPCRKLREVIVCVTHNQEMRPHRFQISNEHRVRVLGSKNKFTTTLPRNVSNVSSLTTAAFKKNSARLSK